MHISTDVCGGRKSLVKPVTWQNISSCSVLSPEIIMCDDTYISRRSENNIKCVMHDDLRWKNRTNQYILPCHWLYRWFFQFHRCGTYSVLSWSHSIIMCCSVLPSEIVMHDTFIGGRSENNIKRVLHDDLGRKNRTTRYILACHWLYEWFSQFHSCGTYSVLSRSPSIKTLFLSVLQLTVTVKKDVIFWITVPCIDDVGSCTYDDACAFIAQFDCPTPFQKYGIPCRCPIAKVSYIICWGALLFHTVYFFLEVIW